MIGSARRRFATALLLALLLGQQIALAQVDQVARGWAFQLYTVYQQGQQTGNWGPFLQSCAMDPVMTKKIFVTVLQYSGEVSADPVAVRDTLQFARDLARFINDNLGDPQPAAIMRAVDAARPNEELAEMVLQYALGLYPELRQSSGSVVANQFHPVSQKYGEKEVLPTLMEQRDLAVYRPLYKNFLAIQLTITFACLDQGIEQVDRGTRLIQEAKATIAARPQAAPWAFQVLDFFQSGLDIYRLSVASELGLLQQAEQQLPMVMDKPENRNWRSGLLLSCARTALAQGNASAAGDYLRRCRGKLDTFVPPPLEYAIRTAEYQTRRLSGYRPDGREKLRDFKQAWQAFSGYRPFQLVHADGFWYYGRKATRFWLAELEPGSAESIEAGQFLMGELGTWSAGMTNPGPWAMSQDEQVFNCEQAGNFLNATMALIEQSLTIFEARASVQAPEASVGELASTLQLVESFPKLLGLNQSDAAERLDLTRAGLYCQLLGRIRLLQARVPTLPAAERLALIEQGVELVGRSREPDIIMDSLLSSGRLARELGRAELAVANWEKALALAESIGYVQQAAEASSLLADQHSKAGDWKQAAFYADKAAQKLQAGVALAAGDTGSARKLARTTDQVTEVSVKAAVQANQPEKALAALVRGKEAQSATAQMRGQGQAQVQVAAVARKEQEVAVLAEQVKSLEAMPASQTRDEMLSSTQKLLAETRTDFLVKSREIRQKYPELYSRVLRFDPLDLPNVQKILPAESAVIQYFPTDDALYLFLVTRDTCRLRSVPISEKQLDTAVTTFVRNLRRGRPGDSSVAQGAAELYGSLIEPCRQDLEGKSTLVLIPSGHLNILPFACLTGADGKPLLEDKLILELAQPTDFMRIALNPPRKVESVVAFANATGDLPAAAKEGDQIAALFPGSKLFKEKEATKKNFFDFGTQAQVLHLATHGESNPENSLANYLKLSGDETIGQDEIFALNLENTSIVTLSACNTAIGDNLDSKFVASLAEAFWLGGSQSVIASLWAVNDESTGLMMTEFYRGLREGKGKAQALRDAQLKVRATPGFEHPYFWAGFLLFGDWR